MPERIYNEWTTLRGKHCGHPIAVVGDVDAFELYHFVPNIKGVEQLNYYFK